MKPQFITGLQEASIAADDFPELAEVGIALVGLARIAKTCTRQARRDDSVHGHLHMTVSGFGAAWIDGILHPLPAGTAYLVPPMIGKWEWTTESTPKEPWEVMFVRFTRTAALGKSMAANTPSVRGGYDPTDLLWVFQRLQYEILRSRRNVIRRHLVAMLAEHTREILAAPAKQIDRLAMLWAAVAARPGANWDLDGLAKSAGTCRETLRQMCIAEHGRSPMQQVTWLRMRHAANLLRTGYHRVEEVAGIAGYANPFGFSTAFKRLHGISPKQFQSQSQNNG